jgi:hypothetical protein
MTILVNLVDPVPFLEYHPSYLFPVHLFDMIWHWITCCFKKDIRDRHHRPLVIFGRAIVAAVIHLDL